MACAYLLGECRAGGVDFAGNHLFGFELFFERVYFLGSKSFELVETLAKFFLLLVGDIAELIEKGRALIRTGYGKPEIEDYQSDQDLKKPQPPLVKAPMTENIIELPMNFDDVEYNTINSFATLVSCYYS